MKRPFRLKMQAPTEHQTQAAFFAWVRVSRNAYPELDTMHAVPNGGARDIRTAAKLKAEGVTPGIPDVMWPHPRGPFNGLAIEFKSWDHGRLSDDQKKIQACLVNDGWLVVPFERSWVHATEIVLGYLQLPSQASDPAVWAERNRLDNLLANSRKKA